MLNLKTLSIGNHADVEITRHAYSKNSQEITFLYEKKKIFFQDKFNWKDSNNKFIDGCTCSKPDFTNDKSSKITR